MTYRWLTDLDVALANGGVPFTPVPFSASDPTGAPSWRERGRPPSTGPFDVQGILCHHTASPIGTTPATELRVILSGNSEAPGPISQLLIGRDAGVYLVAAGRANHGGRGRRPGIDTGGCADMNALLIGIEASNNGVGERWSDAMIDTYGRVVAALANHYGFPTSAVYFHATTGPPNGGCNSKIDPAGPWLRQPTLTRETWNLGTWLAFVDEHRAGGAPVPPEPEPIGDDSMPAYINNGGFVTFAMTGGFCTWVPTPEDADALGVPPPNAQGLRGATVSASLLKGLILIGPMPPGWDAGWFAAWWPDGERRG